MTQKFVVQHQCLQRPASLGDNVRIDVHEGWDARAMLVVGDQRKEFQIRIEYCPFCGERLK